MKIFVVPDDLATFVESLIKESSKYEFVEAIVCSIKAIDKDEVTHATSIQVGDRFDRMALAKFLDMELSKEHFMEDTAVIDINEFLNEFDDEEVD